MNSLFYQNGFAIISLLLIHINGATLLGDDDELRADLVCGNKTLKNGKQLSDTFIEYYEKC